MIEPPIHKKEEDLDKGHPLKNLCKDHLEMEWEEKEAITHPNPFYNMKEFQVEINKKDLTLMKNHLIALEWGDRWNILSLNFIKEEEYKKAWESDII